MSKAELRSDRPFEFDWIDAYCPPDEWYSREGFQLQTRMIRTVGWVLQQGREYMVVAGTYDADAGHYTQVIAIPRACIVKTREVVEDEPST